MAAAVSANEMITAARRLTSTETQDEANAFVTDAEALAVLNGELAELYDIIVEAFDDAPYFRGEQTITLESGVETYPLLADIYKITSVDVVWSADIVKTAKRFTEAERNRFRGLRPSWTQYGKVWFRPVGQNIQFIPKPLSAVSIVVNYTPAFTPLVALSDTFDSQNQWHWAAVWGLAAAIYAKDENEAGVALARAEKEKHQGRIRAQAASRVEGEPPRVQRTRCDDDEDF